MTPSGFNRVISKPQAQLYVVDGSLYFEYKSRAIASGGTDYSGNIVQVVSTGNGDYILRKVMNRDSKETSF